MKKEKPLLGFKNEFLFFIKHSPKIRLTRIAIKTGDHNRGGPTAMTNTVKLINPDNTFPPIGEERKSWNR